jgi:uroporphyrinogen-III synthase
LQKNGLDVYFQPAEFTGKTLAAELPVPGGIIEPSVLYPTSSIADDVLEKALQSRGFKVCSFSNDQWKLLNFELFLCSNHCS